MLKKLMLTAAACLLSGVALAQSTATCTSDPTDPSCVCQSGENDQDCVGGVHRGLVAGVTIHDSLAAGLVQDRTARRAF